MYFTKFDSFITAGNHSQSVVIEVHNIHGGVEHSSPIPISALEDVIEEVATAEVGGPIHIWNSINKQLIVIPHNQIKSIVVKFAH